MDELIVYKYVIVHASVIVSFYPYVTDERMRDTSERKSERVVQA
jgi:hypothetical protein